jgi:hypothetical protein
MILYQSINIRLLAERGKKFNWKKPSSCPICGMPVWGHGYRFCFFEGFTSALPLKRYRCSGCNIVITIRPSSHWSRFQIAISRIISTIRYRLKNFRWPPDTIRQRAGHWMRRFINRCKLDFGFNPCLTQIEALNYYQDKSINFLSV